jgi:hypothetical protein
VPEFKELEGKLKRPSNYDINLAQVCLETQELETFSKQIRNAKKHKAIEYAQEIINGVDVSDLFITPAFSQITSSSFENEQQHNPILQIENTINQTNFDNDFNHAKKLTTAIIQLNEQRKKDNAKIKKKSKSQSPILIPSNNITGNTSRKSTSSIPNEYAISGSTQCTFSQTNTTTAIFPTPTIPFPISFSPTSYSTTRNPSSLCESSVAIESTRSLSIATPGSYQLNNKIQSTPSSKTITFIDNSAIFYNKKTSNSKKNQNNTNNKEKQNK